METIYYTLEAKRLTACAAADGQRACGGQESVCYAFVPRPRKRVPSTGGMVVDFAAYRRALPPKAEPAPAEEHHPAPSPARRRSALALAADLAASGAVVLLLAAVVVRFFTL